MNIVGIIVYLLACFAVAGVLTFLFVMMRPVNSRDELKSWRVLLTLYIVCLGLPYAWGEVLTRAVGDNMKSTVSKALDSAGIDGDLSYYRVIMYTGQSARVVAVAHEKTSDWGGSDKPVVAMTLVKDGSGWRTDSYRIINSFDQHLDGFTFPPYY